jgi:hypothetical protein
LIDIVEDDRFNLRRGGHGCQRFGGYGHCGGRSLIRIGRKRIGVVMVVFNRLVGILDDAVAFTPVLVAAALTRDADSLVRRRFEYRFEHVGSSVEIPLVVIVDVAVAERLCVVRIELDRLINVAVGKSTIIESRVLRESYLVACSKSAIAWSRSVVAQ